MQSSDNHWSDAEQGIVQRAFQIAYDREISALIQWVREQAVEIDKVDDLWRINDLLNSKRHEIDGKYDFEPSALIYSFSRLIKEKWITLEELQGLEKDKLAKIMALSRL